MHTSGASRRGNERVHVFRCLKNRTIKAVNPVVYDLTSKLPGRSSGSEGNRRVCRREASGGLQRSWSRMHQWQQAFRVRRYQQGKRG
jgi:hypothetical protein